MIYLDHNATTPVLPEIREAMLPYLGGDWGNPSSAYRFGSRLKSKIEAAREQVAEFIGCRTPREITFTSGGTESNNAAIHSAIMANPKKSHIVTSTVEHSSVLAYCRFLERHHGYRVTYLPVDRAGILSITDLENAVANDTAVVSLMWANNETGVLFPVEQIAQFCRSRGIHYHCDAVQAAGKLAIDTEAIPFDYLSLTGHKIGAPKGIGALYVAKDVPFVPLMHGGHQERERRGGTENVANIAGLGLAARIASHTRLEYVTITNMLRVQLEKALAAAVPEMLINGDSSPRLSNTTNIRLPGIDNDAALTYLDQAGICASSGSACMESAISPSHVILAMSSSHEHANESLRFSCGRSNTADEIEQVVAALVNFAALAH